MDEFSFIEKYLSPLTFGNKEAIFLEDDAAIITQKPGYDLIITKDAIAQGTHFFKEDSPSKIAKKLLRVNLSDLAAKGATPYCCFLALVLPNDINENWLQKFTHSLKEDMEEFEIFLSGGDTATHNGGLVLSLTALGYVITGKAILRSGAKDGDLIYVTGTIGDSHLGLEILKDNYQDLSPEAKEFAIHRYHIPQPRINIGNALLDIATSSTDISDGLLADLQHICDCSNIGAEIMLDKIPFSQAVIEATNINNDFALKAITGGDDYELIFTAPVSMESQISGISQSTGIAITQIGKVIQGNELKLFSTNGKEIQLGVKGYKHNV